MSSTMSFATSRTREPNAFKALHLGAASLDIEPVPTITLESLTPQMIIAEATLPAPQSFDASGKEIPGGSARARANDHILTVDIPDPRHRGTANAVSGAIHRASARAAQLKTTSAQAMTDHRLHFVAPFVKDDRLPEVTSGFSYEVEIDPITKKPVIDAETGKPRGQLTEVYANNEAGAHRAQLEASRMGLDIPHDPKISPLSKEHQTFFASQPFQSAIHDFQKTFAVGTAPVSPQADSKPATANTHQAAHLSTAPPTIGAKTARPKV